MTSLQPPLSCNALTTTPLSSMTSLQPPPVPAWPHYNLNCPGMTSLQRPLSWHDLITTFPVSVWTHYNIPCLGKGWLLLLSKFNEVVWKFENRSFYRNISPSLLTIFLFNSNLSVYLRLTFILYKDVSYLKSCLNFDSLLRNYSTSLFLSSLLRVLYTLCNTNFYSF